MTCTVGTRIGAILGANDKVVNFLGYGTYDGDHVPPGEVGGFNIGMPNPKLVLDSGKVVWGCECWWGGEERIKSELERYKQAGLDVREVDIDDARRLSGRAEP
jgi:hypothetical protein